MKPLKMNNPESTHNLNFYTLGRFEISSSEGGYIPSARTTKLWDLFKFLLANKGVNIAPEVILENLYPNETYENPKNTLQNIVYRLRKLLCDEHIFSDNNCNILFLNGCYTLSLSDNIWLDTDLFEQYIKKADLYKHESIQKTIDFYEKAIALYRGDYFPELLYDDWVIPKRNYYRRLYIQAILELSKIYKQTKAYDNSILICEKAIQIEPYEEEFHINFMEALISKGRIIEAQKHYGYITGLLYRQFGIKPTIEMQKISYSLKNVQKSSIETINPIEEEYLVDETQSGAIYCDPKTFRSLFIIEKRRNERTNDSVLPISFSIDENDINNSTGKESTSVVKDFRSFLIQSLRKGDVVTTWSDSRLLVLLPKIDYKAIRVISERIIKEFQNKNSAYSEVDFKVNVHSYLP